MKTLRQIDLKEKRVLVRCDFNVPLSEKGDILDDFRIRQTLPTINYLVRNKAKLILMSHLDDPKGEIIENLRMTPIKNRLIQYLNLPTMKVKDCLEPNTREETLKMQAGEILLLENLRFHKEEEEDNDEFSKSLSALGDIYINDAFGACHRAHASIVGVPKYLPSGTGFLLEKEIKIFADLMQNPQKPLVAIIGGAKVETKTKLIDKISKIADFVLVSGLIEKELREKNIKLAFPQKIIKPIDQGDEGRDIGPETITLFKEKINIAKTVFWNGPLGQIEKSEFSKGTEEIAESILQSQAFSVVGGGETVEFVNQLGLIEKFNHVSTGGGAMLAFLSGEKLAGLEALNFYDGN